MTTVLLKRTEFWGNRVPNVYSYNGREYVPEGCGPLSVEFLSTGTVINTKFFEVQDSGECFSHTYSEDWEYIGNDTYSLTKEDGESYTVQVTFSNDNLTFIFIDEDEDGTYRAVYKKV